MPLSSNTTSRAPTSTAVTSRTLPFTQMAILLVPPPMSMFMQTPPVFPDWATAPEP